jgi:hypothetical protein
MYVVTHVGAELRGICGLPDSDGDDAQHDETDDKHASEG